MHKLAVEKGQYCPFHKKTEKLYPITIGSGRTGNARVCKLNAAPPYDIDFVLINMPCTICGLALGRIEEDHADILDGMCLQCFRTQTGGI
jgi:GTP-sensing pleiotropic transcriptional regulator CodY